VPCQRRRLRPASLNRGGLARGRRWSAFVADLPRRGAQLIAALWATINGCSASVTDRGGWCVAAPSNANRLAPLATLVNGQNREKW